MEYNISNLKFQADNFKRQDSTMSMAEAFDLAIKATQMAALIDISARLGKIESKLNTEKR